MKTKLIKGLEEEFLSNFNTLIEHGIGGIITPLIGFNVLYKRLSNTDEIIIIKEEHNKGNSDFEIKLFNGLHYMISYNVGEGFIKIEKKL